MKGTLRGQIPELRWALKGRITDHHRFMLRELLDDLQTVAAKRQRVEKAIAGHLAISLVEPLGSIPGVDIVTAWTCPRNSAPTGVYLQARSRPLVERSFVRAITKGGQRISNRTRKGTRWPRRALCQSAWGASRKKNG